MERQRSLALAVLVLAVLVTAVPSFAGPKWEYGDAAWMKLDLLGQIHYSFLDGAEDEDDFYIRRFRILVNGQIMEGAKVFVQTDYTDAGKHGADPDFNLFDAWLDVQLPLYGHLAGQMDFGDDVTLGFVSLPRDPDAVGLHRAGWSAEEIEDGVERAREVVRAIRTGRFERNESVIDRYDEFARICQTAVFAVDGEDEEADA